MKVIFLDIDGVLNSENWYRPRLDGKRLDEDYPYSEIDPDAVSELNRIIFKTGAKVVVSSVWRLGRTPQELQRILQKKGFSGDVISITPSMSFTRNTPMTVPRGCEIEHWLEKEGKFQRVNWSKEEQLKYVEKAKVKNYVILDDDSDMQYGQREHFVRIPSSAGLTEELADQAIEILNKSLIDLYYEEVKRPT